MREEQRERESFLIKYFSHFLSSFTLSSLSSVFHFLPNFFTFFPTSSSSRLSIARNSSPDKLPLSYLKYLMIFFIPVHHLSHTSYQIFLMPVHPSFSHQYLMFLTPVHCLSYISTPPFSHQYLMFLMPVHHLSHSHQYTTFLIPVHHLSHTSN